MRAYMPRIVPILLAALALPTAAAAQTRVIAVPPQAVLDREMRQLERSHPELAAQVRPGRRLEPAECVVLLDMFQGRNGSERSYVRLARRLWQRVIQRELGRDGAAQLIGSSVNPLAPTPPGLVQNAASWCVAYRPPAR